MKQILIIASCFATMLSAQTHRFIYDYKFVPDAAKKDSVVDEAMALDITSKGSTFQSYVKLKADSTITATVKEQMKTGMRSLDLKGTKMGTVRYKVVKDYPDFKTYLLVQLSSDEYKVLEEKPLNWKISEDKQTIGKYQAQKATTNFGGREWTAWFTTDLPFQDGPFKFSGLPGLIVKLEDKDGTHKFLLNGNQILPDAKEEEQKGGMFFKMSGNTIVVNHDQFIKAYKNYIADPSRSYRQMMSGSSDSNVRVVTATARMNGKEMTQKDITNNMEKSAKIMAKANENFIDLDFFKLTKK